MKNVLLKRALLKKVCIVTGGRTGMGRAIVDELLNQGAIVIVFGRDMGRLKKSFTKNININKTLFLYQVNIAEYSSVKESVLQIIKTFRKIDILINNASINFMIEAEKLLPNMIDLSIDTNLRGHIYLTTLVGKYMKNQLGYKRIINISAYSGGKAYPGFSHFHACKAGLDALTRTLSIEWSRYKILVNSISPGPVLTENFIHAYSRMQRIQGKNGRAQILKMKNSIPLGDFIDLKDIVATVLFLLSDGSKNLTGQVIAVDGGVGITNEYFLEKLQRA